MNNAALHRSFLYAAKGIAYMLRSQRNARIHIAATVIVCALGAWLGLTATDWRWLIAAITLVWSAEAVNTAIECLCDVVSPEYHPAVGRAKDLGAGAVLICAVGALAIGLITFAPYLLR